VIDYLDPVRPVANATIGSGSEHPMRQVTVEASLDAASWTPERRRDVAGRFDELATDWHRNHDNSERYESIDDALARGGPLSGVVVELGAGTGLGSGRLAAAFGSIIALDLSPEMIRQIPTSVANRVLGDGSQLPFRSGSVDIMVLVNMLLFPAEIDRVLQRDGAMIWVNTNAELTPIHLSAEAVDAALPGNWTGVASRAGSGSWVVFRRST
jgi:hypothetical protein